MCSTNYTNSDFLSIPKLHIFGANNIYLINFGDLTPTKVIFADFLLQSYQFGLGTNNATFLGR